METKHFSEICTAENSATEVASAITKVHNIGVTEKDLNDHLMELHTTAFKRVPNCGLPAYEIDNTMESKKRKTNSKFSPLVEVTRNGSHLCTKPVLCGCFKKESEYQQTGFLEYEKRNHL